MAVAAAVAGWMPATSMSMAKRKRVARAAKGARRARQPRRPKVAVAVVAVVVAASKA
ncbi:hypothetical protein D3C84_634240 [compost metagenome]